MVNQKAISVRLDYDVLHIADQEAFVSGTPRNRIINDALKLYVAIADARRRHLMYDKLDWFYYLMNQVGLKENQLP